MHVELLRFTVNLYRPKVIHFMGFISLSTQSCTLRYGRSNQRDNPSFMTTLVSLSVCAHMHPYGTSNQKDNHSFMTSLAFLLVCFFSTLSSEHDFHAFTGNEDDSKTRINNVLFSQHGAG